MFLHMQRKTVELPPVCPDVRLAVFLRVLYSCSHCLMMKFDHELLRDDGW